MVGSVHGLRGESGAFGAEENGDFLLLRAVVEVLVDILGVVGRGHGEYLKSCCLDLIEGGDPVGLVRDLGEGDGEGVSH